MRYIGGEICTLTNQTITGEETLIENVERVRIRDCHFGLTEVPGKASDSLTIGRCKDVDINQSVLRWSVDECLGVYDVDRLVVRDSLIYESLNDTGLHKTGGGASGASHGCGGLYWTRRPGCEVLFHQVMFAHHNYRAMCSVGAKEGGSVVSDFCNCVSVDCWNYYWNDQGDTDRNIRGCVFLQTDQRFKPSMWTTSGGLYIEDSWCIHRDGRVTRLEDELDEELRARLAKTPFKVKGMQAATSAEGLLERLVARYTETIPLDPDDVRVLGRISSHQPGVTPMWSGVIDSQIRSPIKMEPSQ